MQSLDVISINIWQILISLFNLIILFLILKKFLFKPVKKMLSSRQEALDNMYLSAEKAIKEADLSKKEWEERLNSASMEADSIINEATKSATLRSDKIIEEEKLRAESIVHQAETEAELELKKAEAGIKQEIVTVSGLLAKKLIKREINTDDHRVLINSVIEKIGDNDDADE
jgi:F-type H+-transporting ATPase subunit b